MVLLDFSPQFNVTADKNCDEAYKLKEIVRVDGTKLIQDCMAKYIADLRIGNNISFTNFSVIHVCIYNVLWIDRKVSIY